MIRFLINIRSDKIIFQSFVASIFLTLTTLLYILVNYKNLPPLIPVFNQLPWGAKRIAETPGIFIPIVLYFFVFIFNIIFSSVIYSKNPLVARVVAATTLLLAVMNFLYALRIIFI